jgi:predicted dehydrogenase
MKVIIIGCGVQGNKRAKVAGNDLVAFVDDNPALGLTRSIEDVQHDYDAALVCTSYAPKYQIVKELLKRGKHVLVEKPLWVERERDLAELHTLARKNNVVLYTAHNHRFEPHWIAMRDLVRSGTLGGVYRCRMSYGFGTAALARLNWRDRAPCNVLWEIAPHLIDAALWWFGDIGEHGWRLVSSNCFENRCADHAVIAHDRPSIEIECSYVSWKNHFTVDIYAENGSAHIDGLCKWGPSTFTHRIRVMPSGKPIEVATTISQEDTSWTLEYHHFQNLIAKSAPANANEHYMHRVLNSLSSAMSDSPTSEYVLRLPRPLKASSPTGSTQTVA